MRSNNWLTTVSEMIEWMRGSRTRCHTRGVSRRAFLEPLEDRVVLATDFGDAPDTGAGTGARDYNTLAADEGPSHIIVTGLRIGASVDADDGTMQGPAAAADDTDQALPDDEDGLSSPATDLAMAIGSQPAVSVIVTNTTGNPATLWGWVDYDSDGVFDNTTERAQATVANGTEAGIVTLALPVVPGGSNGETYARFRLSTDAVAGDPTGAATDGEVEDYLVNITQSGIGVAAAIEKIANDLAGGPTLGNSDNFGSAVSSIGDLDGDGVRDLAVGAYEDNTGGRNRGALHVLMMNANGTVKSSQKIAHETGGGPTLANKSFFGTAVTSLGDLDGDGVPDLAVGAPGDKTGGYYRGAVHVLFMNAEGTVKSSQKIADQTGGGPALSDYDLFGNAVASVGDLDGDGVTDLAVGAYSDSTGGDYRGSLHVLMMNADGTVKSATKIAHNTGGGPALSDGDLFGSSVTSLGDLDGDGVADLAVGAYRDSTGGISRGAVHVLFLNSDGTAKGSQHVAHETGGGPTLANYDAFGVAVTSLGDLDGDGVPDIAVGAYGDSFNGYFRGAVHVLLMNPTGKVKSSWRLAHETGGGPTLAHYDSFGSAVASLGDLNGDGVSDLAVGTPGDDTGGSGRGATHILFLSPDPTPRLISHQFNGIGTSSRSSISKLVLHFDRNVTIGDGLTIFSHTTGKFIDVSTATLQNNGSTEVTWDFSAFNFPDGDYAVRLPREAITSKEGGVLIENSQVLLFHVLAGDGNGDRAVDFLDFAALSASFGQTVGPFGPGDFDGNGVVNFLDFAMLSSNFGASISPLEFDFGDAPEAGTSFPTTLANNGARHVIGSGLFLGSGVDGEVNGQPNPNATGDDDAGSDDGDGVTFGPLQVGKQASVTVIASVPERAVLDAWVDFNADGDWDDAGEQVFVEQELKDGSNTLAIPIPSNAALGTTFARFRVTQGIACFCTRIVVGWGYSFSGLALQGEVEDYQVTIAAAFSSFRAASPSFARLFTPILVANQESGEPDSVVSRNRMKQRLDDTEAKPVANVGMAIRRLALPEHSVRRLGTPLTPLDESLVDQLMERETDLGALLESALMTR